ncbi:hypothetical protein SUGI_0222060 [Cryptomeria japonica]|nr:hypothetical protein SUGI_0222060 [Cryptomeria japonica]
MAIFRNCRFLVIVCFAINGVWAATSTSDIIIKACNDSSDRDFCISSLSKAPGALQANLTQLSVIANGLCIEEGKPVYDFLVRVQKRHPKFSSALGDCVLFLFETRLWYNNTGIDLSELSDSNFYDNIQFVQVGLKAAIAFQDDCVAGLNRTHAPITVISSFKSRTDHLTMVTDDALAVVNLLAKQGHT